MKAKDKIFFSFFIRFGFEAFLDISLSMLINLCYLETDTGMDIYSSIATFVCLVFIILLIVTTTVVALYISTHKLKYPDFQKKFGSFLSDIKLNSKSTRVFNLMFLARRFLLALTLVAVVGYGRVQLIIVSILNLGIMIHALAWRPYLSSIANVHNVFNELMLLVI